MTISQRTQTEIPTLEVYEGGVTTNYSGQPITLTMSQLQTLKMGGLNPVAYAVLAILSCKANINSNEGLNVENFIELFAIPPAEGKGKPWMLTEAQVRSAISILEGAAMAQSEEQKTIQLEIF